MADRAPVRDDRYRLAARSLAFLARPLERAAGDLSLAQYRVLSLVAVGDERASLLAQRLSVGRPTVTAVVDGLVERGLVSREAVAGDRRQIRLVITPAGRVALEATETVMAERVAVLTQGVTDPDALFKGLAEMRDALEARLRERIEGLRS